MKTRIISAIVALLLALPVFIMGGIIFQIGVLLLAILGLREMIHIKETKKELPGPMSFLAYLVLGLILFNAFNLQYKIVACLFLTFFIPTVLYHGTKKYDIEDAFFLATVVVFLGFSFNILNILRYENINLLIYLLLITTITDTYAYIVGSLVGSHKMIPNVSPKKTWEGFIGGVFFGGLISSLFYHNVINSNISLVNVILMTLFLVIIGQIGDLFFSVIKRHFDQKDFSNIMPGHGGVLDRLDSLIFVLLAFTFFIK